jgi:putative DNA primase/helicase
MGKNGKLTKPPFRADAPGEHASSADPATWGDIATAMLTYTEGNVDGIGFALRQSDIGAIDIDDCRNKETGELHPWAAGVVDRSNTYCEVTPSREGIRVIGRCAGPPVHRKFNVADGVSCELYRSAERYITITGQQIGNANELGNIDGLIDTLLVELKALKQQQTKKPSASNGRGAGASKHDLASLIKVGCGADFGSDRSRAVWYVINQLLKRGDNPEAITATIINPANGISAHCLDQSNPEAYARRQVEKAQQEQQKGGDDVEAELQRLAKLSVLDYERTRKAAAEKLEVRATMLDKLVDIKRAELGLNEDGGLQGHAMSFPEPERWPEPVDGADLLDALSGAIARHVVIAEHSRDIAALWAVHTYLLDAFMITPRLAVRSPVRRCGKTTLLDVLARLVHRPLPAANISAAAVFRVVESHRPCLLIDEADTFLRDNEELRGVLNSGHRRGGSVLRTVGDDHEPRSFATYAACVIALIGQLPGTLSDRSVTIHLKRRLPSEKIEPFRLDRTEHLDVLARQIARFARDNAEAVRAADPAMPPGIFNRDADNLRPLLAIADVAGGEWPERARKAALAGREASEDEGPHLEQLLGDIRDIFTASDHLDRISSADLVARLVEFEGRPWAEYGHSGKPLSQNRLAALLKPTGIGPNQIKFDGPKGYKGYRSRQFDEAFERYLPPKGALETKPRNKPDEMGTSEHFQTETAASRFRFEKREKSNNDGQSFGVSVPKGENGAKACAQCNGTPDGAERLCHVDGADVWLHPECERIYRAVRRWGVR